MMTKPLWAAGALVLASFAMASDKTFEVAFGVPVDAGNLRLSAGTYNISEKGGDAIFTDVNTGRMYSVPVTVDNLALKNEATKVSMSNQNGHPPRIRTIALGGHAVDLEFGNQ